MRTRTVAIVCGLIFLQTAAWAQEGQTVLDTYQRNFARSSLSTKLELLVEASKYEGVNMGPLYGMAVTFALNNASLLQTDTVLRDLAVYAVRMMQKSGYTAGVDAIWELFQAYKENTVRVPALLAIGDLARGNASMVAKLNDFLSTQVSLYRSGLQPDYATIEACIVALGRLGDGSSFPYLFSAFIAGINDGIAKKASESMAMLKGDYKSFLAESIARGSPQEKAAAFKAGMVNPAFDERQRAELAEAALAATVAFTSSSPGEKASARDLRFAAVRELTARQWQPASALAVRHFYEILSDYNRALAGVSNLLEAIACLGAMGSSEAAQALALFLQTINSETEQGTTFDEQITLAVIKNLGILGDKVAFDYLLYVGYLQYTETVKRAAREALQKIKW